MRPSRFRGVIGFGDQKYSQRASNYRIRVGEDPTAGMQHHSTPRISPGYTLPGDAGSGDVQCSAETGGSLNHLAPTCLAFRDGLEGLLGTAWVLRGGRVPLHGLYSRSRPLAD